MSELKRKITSVVSIHGELLSDEATVFANDNGQLIQVPLSSLNLDDDGADLEVANDADVGALLEALDIPEEGV